MCSSDPGRIGGGLEGRNGPANGDSEPSDDEMLSLSSQQSNASNEKAASAQATPRKAEAPPPAVPPPSEDVDLLGLDGDVESSANVSPRAPTNADLLGDLFGAPQLSSVSSPAHSSPRPSAAASSSSPSPRLSDSECSPHLPPILRVSDPASENNM